MPPPDRAARRWWASCLAVMLTQLATGPSTAWGQAEESPEPIALDWRAPLGCPSAADVRAEIHRLLGGPPDGGSRRVVARGLVMGAEGGRWHLTVRTRTGEVEGARELTGDSCQQLGNIAALIVALAFDPDAVAAARSEVVDRADPVPSGGGVSLGSSAGTTPPPATPPSAAPVPAPLPAAPVGGAAWAQPPDAPGPQQPEETPVGGQVGVFATGDLGSLPAPAFGLSVGGGITLWRVRIDLSGTYWFEQEATLADSPKGGNFSFLSAALAGCPILLPGDLELGVCTGLELGRMHAEGFGVTDPSESAILWAAFRAGGTASWMFADPVALRLQIDMVVPFTRPQWVLQNVGAIDQPGSVTGRALLGSELRF